MGRGFATITKTDNTVTHYALEERDNGFFWVKWYVPKGQKEGKVLSETQISKSTRNYNQAELKAKKRFREDVEKQKQAGGFKTAYSSMWFEPVGSYQKGGIVQSTGLAEVHKGELVIPTSVTKRLLKTKANKKPAKQPRRAPIQRPKNKGVGKGWHGQRIKHATAAKKGHRGRR